MNKTIFDENNGIEFSTGTNTIISKVRLSEQSDERFPVQFNLYLCQGCTQRIVSSEACFIRKPCIGVYKGRFKRKNEVAEDFYFILVSVIPENKVDKRAYSYHNAYFFETDALDYVIYSDFANEATK